jgi:ATP/maltotriose-dependent transcriptional regulator MalT
VVAIDGDSGRATELAEEAAQFAQERGDATLSFWAAIDLARLALGRGDAERARTLLQDAALVEQRGGFLSPGFLWLTELAFLALYEGDDAQALSLFRRSIAVQQQVRIFALLPDCLIGFAVIAAAQAKEERAARLLGAADGLRKVVGPPPHPQPTTWQRDRAERTLASVRAGLGDERFTAARAEGHAMSLERAIAYAIDPRLASNPRR